MEPKLLAHGRLDPNLRIIKAKDGGTDGSANRECGQVQLRNRQVDTD